MKLPGRQRGLSVRLSVRGENKTQTATTTWLLLNIKTEEILFEHIEYFISPSNNKLVTTQCGEKENLKLQLLQSHKFAN